MTREEQIRQWAAEGRTQSWCAAQLGVSRSAFCSCVSVLGIVWVRNKPGPKSSPVDRMARTIVARLRRGEALWSIAHDYGQTAAGIHAYLKRRGLPTCARKAMR